MFVRFLKIIVAGFELFENATKRKQDICIKTMHPAAIPCGQRKVC
jgi:H2-forming N5,N10-methylenetetrahydromethanopterin dehydrogenase-like enzyme